MNLFRRLPLVAVLGLALAFIASSTLRAQTFTQVRDTGPRANRINIVFIAEGYTAAESAKFSTDAATKIQTLVGNESWSRFADSINVFTLFVASAESGADDPVNNIVRDTYFNSTFNTSGIDRLLALPGTGTTKVRSLLTQYLPDWDVVLVLVNSTKYGGSGGSFTVVSLNVSSDDVMLHELGHSFAKLTDEYVDDAAAPSYPPAEYPNATQKSTRATSPWSAFISPGTAIPTLTAADENTVGLFLGAHYRSTGFYRPTNNSKMRSLGRPFGPVNLRAFGTAVHGLNLNLASTAPVITQQPAGASVAIGQAYTLHVVATGAGPLTYQWRLDGVYLATGTGADWPITTMNSAQAGVYAVEVTNAAGTTLSAQVAVQLPGVNLPPSIDAISPAVSLTAGDSVTLSVTASGIAPLTYQWLKDGVAIAGATSATLTLSKVPGSAAGSYTVTITNPGGSVTSAPVILTVVAARLTNVSVRTTLAANQILTVGFTMQGGAKPLLIRAAGPGLAALGVTGTMADPKLTLFKSSVLIEANDNWSSNATAVANANAAVGAFPFAPGSLDAALVRSIDGGHTVQVSGPAAGNVIVEAYDAGSGLTPRLTNLSALNRVGTGGDVLIAGFTIAGFGTKNLLIRAVGPTLAAVQFGLAGMIADPKLEVYSGPTKIGENDNWAPALTETFGSVGAFALIPGSKDAALVVSLPPGGYTVQVFGADGGTGTALVEIYELP